MVGEITEVNAAAIPAPDSPRPEIDDSAFCLFKFASGALGLLRNSWRQQRQTGDAETFEVYGTKGSLFGELRTPWRESGIPRVRILKNGGGHGV